MAYQSEKEIFEIVRGFENGTIRREDWRHGEHLTVAAYYVFHHDFETALAKMRDGIFNLLRCFEIDLTEEMPYHETLTVFWMRTIEDFKNSREPHSLPDICRQAVEQYDKNYPLLFYSHERLFSDQARKSFVEADLHSPARS